MYKKEPLECLKLKKIEKFQVLISVIELISIPKSKGNLYLNSFKEFFLTKFKMTKSKKLSQT